MTVTGTYSETVDDVTVRHADWNVIVEFTATVQFIGGFTGRGTSVGTQIIHPTGALTIQAIVLCTCTVDGEVVGELVLRFTAIGLYPVAKDGQFVMSGTGGSRICTGKARSSRVISRAPTRRTSISIRKGNGVRRGVMGAKKS
jgi:hypothetical protein